VPVRKSELRRGAAVLRAVGFTLALLVAALTLGGCPALMVPGLAYSGYKAIHNDKATPTTEKAKTRDRSTGNKQPPGSAVDQSIE
jgi:hypothetical protein